MITRSDAVSKSENDGEILVTGSSSGFGLELTKHVLAHGDIAVATLRKPEMLSELVEAYDPKQLLVLKMDVTQPQDISEAFAKAKETFGRIDVVFNNAGVTLIGEIEATPDAAAREHFETNFWGAVNVTREAIRFFREENEPGVGGRLIQNSSKHGFAVRPAVGFYSAAKHAIEAISEALSKELDPVWNIKITILEPGVFLVTSINKPTALCPLLPAYRKPSLAGSSTREWYAKVLRGEIFGVPSGDITKASDVIWRLSLLSNPPLRLPLGKDSVADMEEKQASLSAELAQFEALAMDV